MQADERADVRGVVLAGGASTRFDGGDKALAAFEGRPLVAHAVSAVDTATTGRPLLAVADEERGETYRTALASADTLSAGSVETVTDAPDLSGPLAGLFAAAEASSAPWLFVCACDMPLVTSASIDALRKAVPATPTDGSGADKSGTDAVVPVVDGHDQPLHAVYRRSALRAVRDRMGTGDALMALLDALDSVERVYDEEATVDFARATTNVNTRADLDRLADRADG